MAKKFTRQEVSPDPVYNNVLIAKLTNYIMQRGQKQTARRVVYKAMDLIKEKTKREPLDVFSEAIEKARPLLEIRPRRVGGAVYQVPKEVGEDRGTILALRWILASARKKKGKPMAVKLSNEILEIIDGQGDVLRKRENTHKMAEANRSFAYLNR